MAGNTNTPPNRAKPYKGPRVESWANDQQAGIVVGTRSGKTTLRCVLFSDGSGYVGACRNGVRFVLAMIGDEEHNVLRNLEEYEGGGATECETGHG